jgi:hypothetical protein
MAPALVLQLFLACLFGSALPKPEFHSLPAVFGMPVW